MNKLSWSPSASSVNNGDFISIQAYSGYNLAMVDPETTEYLFELEVPDEILGKGILDSLKQSRALSIDEARKMNMNGDKNYDEWIQKLMTRYGYKTKRALFRNMKHCDIYLCQGIIRIEPKYHDKLEGWSGEGFREEDYVKIPADSPPAEIGAALRLAFSRCTGMGT